MSDEAGPSALPTGKFACSQDVMLLQQVALSRPWEGEYGKVMTLWSDVATELNRMPGFGMVKKAGAVKTRFEYLLAKHEKGESASLRKSGTSEEYSERDQLLTDIKLRVDDFAQHESVRKDAEKRKLEGIENSGVIMRQMAMAELECAEDAPTKPRRKKVKAGTPAVDISSLMDMIRRGIDDKERREAERIQFDRDQANRQAEALAAQQRVLVDLVAAIVKKME